VREASLKIEVPPLSPDIAIEVRSPGERLRNLQRKVELYLENGTKLVVDIDPEALTITAIDRGSVRRFRKGDKFEHPAAPGLSFDVDALFEAARRRSRQKKK